MRLSRQLGLDMVAEEWVNGGSQVQESSCSWGFTAVLPRLLH
jgi:hypothetical protein